MSSSRKRERPEVLLLTLDLRVSAFPTVLQSKDILCGVKCHHSPHWAAASLKKANLFSFFFFSELSVENHSRGHNIYLKERRRCSINGGVESEPFTLSIYLSFGYCLSCWYGAIAQGDQPALEAHLPYWTRMILKRFSSTHNSSELISIHLLTECLILCQIYFTILL